MPKTISVFVRIPLSIIFLRHKPKDSRHYYLWLALTGVIILPIISRLLMLINSNLVDVIGSNTARGILRLDIVLTLLMSQLTFYVLLGVSRKRPKGNPLYYIFFLVNSSLGLFFLTKILFFPHSPMRESILETFVANNFLYFRVGSLALALVSCWLIHASNKQRPKIIRTKLQPRVFIPFATILVNLMVHKLLLVPNFHLYPNLQYVDIALSLITTGIFYLCIKNIIRLRFLNIRKHIGAPSHMRNITDFRSVLEQLSVVGNVTDLEKITQNFFEQSFGIQKGFISFYARQNNQLYPSHNILTTDLSPIEQSSENYLSNLTEYNDEGKSLLENKILNHDEIEFDHYYDETRVTRNQLDFLDALEADLFVPIFYDAIVTGYIVIDRNARGNKLYTDVERDEMIMYAGYMSQVIHILQHKNIAHMLSKQHRNIRALGTQEQTISQRNEMIQSLIDADNSSEFGIVYYLNRKFINGNHLATELLSVDLNEQTDHPLSKTFMIIVDRLRRYDSPYTMTSYDVNGKPLMVTGIPTATRANVVFVINRPPISKELKKHRDDISQGMSWHHVIALETTKNGRLIHEKFPGYSKPLASFKVGLLKAALSSEPILLEMGSHDLVPSVELIHHISSLRSIWTVDTLDYEDQSLLCEEIFGINPLIKEQQLAPLLKRLDNQGILHIKNVHALDIQIQRRLLDFMQSGTFTMIRSDQRIASTVRIICSTDKSPAELRKEYLLESFHEILMESHVRFWFKDQHTIHKNQMINHIEHMWFAADDPYELAKLTEDQRRELIASDIPSFSELKHRVHHVMERNANPNAKAPRVLEDSEFETGDPMLEKAEKMGKGALKDPAVMIALWEKFHNQQKIADFLGVNRSSVSRRCKEFNLGTRTSTSTQQQI